MLRLRELAQKDEGVAVELTEGSWWSGLLRQVDVGEVRAAGRGGARGGGGGRTAPGLLIHEGGPHESCGGVSGVREARCTPAARNFPNSSSPSTAGSGENSGARRAGVEG